MSIPSHSIIWLFLIAIIWIHSFDFGSIIFTTLSPYTPYPLIHISMAHKKLILHVNEYKPFSICNDDFQLLRFADHFIHHLEIWNVNFKLKLCLNCRCKIYLDITLSVRQTLGVWGFACVGFCSDVKVKAEFSTGSGFELYHVPHHVHEFIEKYNELDLSILLHAATYPGMELDFSHIIFGCFYWNPA